MKQEERNADELVVQTLSVLPLMAKKLFGPIHVLHNSDLHHTHFHIMNIIADAGNIRTTEIARKLAIKKSNLTPLISKLKSKNFIYRHKDEIDRRVIYIQLTEEGNAFLNEKKKMLEKEVEERLTALTNEDRNLLQESVLNLHTILSKLDE